jgi:hypothetical protein
MYQRHGGKRIGASGVVPVTPALLLALAAALLLAACSGAPQPGRPAVAGEPPATDTAEDAPAASITTSRSDLAATLPARQPVVIDNPYGDVLVRFGGFEHGLETHVVLQEPTGAPHIVLRPATVDGRYTIAPRLPSGATLRERQRMDLSVFVPEGHALVVRTGQGDINVRGVHGDIDLKSTAGDIRVRGIKGAIRAETGEGAIEASLDTAPKGARQRLATTTGNIEVGVDDALDAELDMATSAQFATDYSIEVARRPGEEPNKRARAVIGAKASKLVLESRRGEIRLIRRAGFTTVGGEPSRPAAAAEGQDEDNDSD